MAYIPDADASDPDVAALFDAGRDADGEVPNYLASLARRPDVYRAWSALGRAVSGRLEPRVYELVTVAAAQVLGSRYCSLAHGERLLGLGLADDELLGVLDGDLTPLSAQEAEAVRFAGRMARRPSAVTQQDVDGLRAAGWTDDEVHDIAAAVAARCYFTAMLAALGVEPDGWYSHRLKDPVLDRLSLGRPPER